MQQNSRVSFTNLKKIYTCRGCSIFSWHADFWRKGSVVFWLI